MKIVIFLMALILLFSSVRAEQIYPLNNDYDSLNSRIETLLDPNLKEFVFSTYILKLDQGGLIFMALLKNAAARGVKIKGVIDSKIIGESPEVLNFLKDNNIQIYYYNPIKLKYFYFLKPVKSFLNLNKRLHDKIWSAKFFDDQKKEYRFLSLFGDKNISLDYYRQAKAYDSDVNPMLGHELLVDSQSLGMKTFEYIDDLIKSSDLAYPISIKRSDKTKEVFNQKISDVLFWVKTRYEERLKQDFNRTKEKPSVEIEPENINFLKDESDRTTYAQLLSELRAAQPGEEIYIENPYFVLEPELVETLKVLREKSCKVTLVGNLPKNNNVWIAGKALEVDLTEIARLGVDVYLIEKKSNITHAKLAIIGNRKLYIGSSNFDPRSLVLNSESGIILEDSNIVSIYKEKIAKKIQKSTVIAVSQGRILSTKNTFGFDFTISSGDKIKRCQSYYQRFDQYKPGYFKNLFINTLRSFL